jgi:murein DD-endopeptidase MepM/ murein hydrolase activator NlpD
MEKRDVSNRARAGTLRRCGGSFALAVALSSLFCPILPAEAGVLSQLRSSIESLRDRRQNSYEQSHQSRRHASALQQRGLAVAERLEITQRLLQSANETYENYRRQTKQTEARIIETQHEVQIAEKKYRQHLDRFQRRLASFQRSGQPTFLQVVLGSRTLSDLTRRTYLFNAIATQDAEMYKELDASRNELEQKRNMLQSQWHQRNRLVQATYREQDRIARAESEQHSLLAEIQNSRVAALSFAAAQDEAAGEMEGTIQNLTSRRAEIIAEYQRRAAAERAVRWAATRRSYRSVRSTRRRSAGSSRSVRYTGYRYTRRSNRRSGQIGRYDSPQLAPMSLDGLPMTQVAFHDDMVPDNAGHGGLSEDFESSGDSQSDNSWRLPVRGRLSSRFGMRYHPILHRNKVHTGDDLAASRGTPIHAAKDGTVLYAGWTKGYGNTVIIDHGNGVTTLYGHASKTVARAGQHVKGGDYIANVGSTGYSTGPHLHFEVRKNGKPVNPLPYLKKSR